MNPKTFINVHVIVPKTCMQMGGLLSRARRWQGLQWRPRTKPPLQQWMKEESCWKPAGGKLLGPHQGCRYRVHTGQHQLPPTPGQDTGCTHTAFSSLLSSASCNAWSECHVTFRHFPIRGCRGRVEPSLKWIHKAAEEILTITLGNNSKASLLAEAHPDLWSVSE